MIVPKYWAEARLQKRTPERQVTVRRFGWSDTNEADAQVMAEERAAEALSDILSGKNLVRLDPKVPYGGADGLPIREEIIRTNGETIITRNSYGALCLNTPNVLFGDIDFELEHRTWNCGCSVVIGLISAIVLWQISHSFLVTFFGTIFFTSVILGAFEWLSRNLAKRKLEKQGGFEAAALNKISSFVTANPDWHLRIYRTPAGIRFLAMHDTFDPSGSPAQDCFKSLQVDRIYALMCRNQNCFRARVSPKPWRIGVNHRLKPRPGTWPIKDEHLPQRQLWVKEYESSAKNFSSCRFIKAIGSSKTCLEAEAVKEIHDNLAQASSDFPMG